jgi:D-lactate dehydrogenase (cytochrome)
LGTKITNNLKRPEPSALASAIEALAARFGNRLITSRAVREQHAHTTTWLESQPPDAVVMAQETSDIQDVVRICAKHSVPVIAFGTGTSLEGQVNAPAGGICVDLRDMNKVLEVHAEDLDCVIQPGVTRKALNEHLRDQGVFFPIDPGADASLGGMASTRASGTNAVRYGTMRDNVLALKVVRGDGGIITTGTRAKKSSAGYDLTHLFIGAEGTLGIITAAVLRLVPRPRSTETAWLGVPSPEAAVEMLGIANDRTAGGVTSFELMERMGVEVVLKHGANVRNPLTEPYPYNVLIELSSQARSGLRAVLEEILADGHERELVLDATIADNLEQGKAFWRIREMFGEMQRFEGASIKHDISVPVAAIPAFIKEANAAVVKLIPGARPLPFGHVGDGNIHYNVTQPVGTNAAEFMKREEDVHDVVFAVVAKLNGSISAEHGIGIVKRDRLPQVKDKVAIELMRTLKRTLDPKGILNPGKVL